MSYTLSLDKVKIAYDLSDEKENFLKNFGSQKEIHEKRLFIIKELEKMPKQKKGEVEIIKFSSVCKNALKLYDMFFFDNLLVNVETKINFKKQNCYRFSLKNPQGIMYISNTKKLRKLGENYAQKYCTKSYEKHFENIVHFVFAFEYLLGFYLFNKYFSRGLSNKEKNEAIKKYKDNAFRKIIFGTERVFDLE